MNEQAQNAILKTIEEPPEYCKFIFIAKMSEVFLPTIISRLIEGKYFNVEQMLSDDYETHIIVDKQSIASCIQRTKLVVSDSEKRPVILNVTDGNVLITMNGSKGKFEENLEIEKNGKDIEIGFNPDYLISTFNAITDEKVDMYFINSK